MQLSACHLGGKGGLRRAGRQRLENEIVQSGWGFYARGRGRVLFIHKAILTSVNTPPNTYLGARPLKELFSMTNFSLCETAVGQRDVHMSSPIASLHCVFCFMGY